jgi:hypothetical protein
MSIPRPKVQNYSERCNPELVAAVEVCDGGIISVVAGEQLPELRRSNRGNQHGLKWVLGPALD